MPRVAVDFSKKVIYHFVCKDEMIKCSYVGSTTNFVKRKVNHKHHCHNETAKNHHTKVYQTIREKGGWINWDMKPLEEFPCENNTQQVIREQYWIDRLKPELNSQVAYREGDTEHEKKKAYYKANAGEIIEKNKAYYELNAEAIAEKSKAYRETNAEAIHERHKAYREKNAEAIKEYREANRDKLNENKRNRRKLKKEQQETKQ